MSWRRLVEGVGGFFVAPPAVVDRRAAELRRRFGRVARRGPALIPATRFGIAPEFQVLEDALEGYNRKLWI